VLGSAPDGDPHGDFASLSSRYRPELLAYCYRMLGSFHDAEDLVQETYLRAWRSYDGFEGRASVRTWLYRIATNACLSALEHRSRRLLPAGLNGSSDTPEEQLDPSPAEVSWLQPVPDARLAPGPSDPAAVVEERSSFRLALIAALQYLPARQRAVFILREALAMPAAEIARLLDTSVPAVKSALQRARTQLEEMVPLEDEVVEPSDPATRTLLDRFVAAFDDDDLAALVDLLTDDVVTEMPPSPSWFAGRDAVARLFATQVFCNPGQFALELTSANGQPAFGVYKRAEDGVLRAHSVMVLTLTRLARKGSGGLGIRRIYAFREPSLLAMFGLPEVRPLPVG
jgi:RNA polymerase sigma-70 factor (ECF subfamily)